jgi:hypothetical protein
MVGPAIELQACRFDLHCRDVPTSRAGAAAEMPAMGLPAIAAGRAWSTTATAAEFIRHQESVR